MISLLFFVPLWIAIIVLFAYGYAYRNPYKLIMVFGKKGSGKTTLIAKLTYKYLKKGRPVYSTVPIPGAYLFDVEKMGLVNFPPESVIFIDEVGMIWDNRNYKNLKNHVRDYFKLQRHYRHTVYLFSQAFDVDIKLRNLTDHMYLTKTYLNCISIARRVQRNIIVVHPTGDAEARIADDLHLVSLICFWVQSVIVTWVPRWVRYFDSFDVPELPEDADFVKCSYPVDFEERSLRFKVVNWLMSKVDVAGSSILSVYWKVASRLGFFKCLKELDDVGSPVPYPEDTQSEEEFIPLPDDDDYYLDE